MKYKAKDYAKAIIGAEAVNLPNFLKLLEKNGDVKELKEIVVLVEKMSGRVVMIETARKTKISWPKNKNDIVKEKINPELVAGIKITVNGEKQLDFSLKSKLEKIFQ